MTVILQDASGMVLTTDHPASSYGVPVLVRGGAAYGPADVLPADEIYGAVRAAMPAGRYIAEVEFAEMAALRYDAAGVDLARRFLAADPTGPQIA